MAVQESFSLIRDDDGSRDNSVSQGYDCRMARFGNVQPSSALAVRCRSIELINAAA